MSRSLVAVSALFAGADAFSVSPIAATARASRTSEVNMAVGLIYSTTTGEQTSMPLPVLFLASRAHAHND
jgi:hypothetical protein